MVEAKPSPDAPCRARPARGALPRAVRGVRGRGGGGLLRLPHGDDPVGMKVSATARLRSIERRKMWFDIEVNDEKGKCGEGSHLRIMVAPKGIQEKAEQKKD